MIAQPRSAPIPGFKDLFASAFQNIDVRGFGPLKVLGVDGSVGIQHFRVTQRYLRAGGTFDVEHAVSGDVLSQIKYESPLHRLGHFFRLQDVRNPDRLGGKRNKHSRGFREDMNLLPLAVVEAR